MYQDGCIGICHGAPNQHLALSYYRHIEIAGEPVSSASCGRHVLYHKARPGFSGRIQVVPTIFRERRSYGLRYHAVSRLSHWGH